MATLCLNMIVKNETVNLARCLDSIAPYISHWVIGDTGSTDGTQDFIKDYFASRGISGELHEFPFQNFEHARNEALDRARASALPFDYVLFADADMELVVEDEFFRSKLDASAYHIVQRSDALTYHNVRLVRRDIDARYHGVTHECIVLPEDAQTLSGVWFKDHADGANRPGKFERDIQLLEKALASDPDNARYQFYLAQSYRDAGRLREAVLAYGRRADMGGWEEEAWNARLQQARCLLSLGSHDKFIMTAIAAYEMRPTRAEPLFDLAKFYRERGMNAASLLFSEVGVEMKQPTDILFVENHVYEHGLAEEYSIAAYYSNDPAQKAHGARLCDELATSHTVPHWSRELARSNLCFYAKPLAEFAPSFVPHRLDIAFPEGFTATNPSVTFYEGEIRVIQRAVNYKIVNDVEYHTPNDGPITTRNFLLTLRPDFSIKSSRQLMGPELPEPQYHGVRGLEDMRVFEWRESLWVISTAREMNADGICEQVLARIDEYGMLTDWRVMQPDCPRQHQKNWMPFVDDEDNLRFIFLCDPTQILDEQASLLTRSFPPVAVETFRGGSQAVPFDDGWLALVHEVVWQGRKRIYQHRFIWLDSQFVLRKMSPRFYMNHFGIEFVAGLTWHHHTEWSELLFTYGVQDCESWIAQIDHEDVSRMLYAITG